MLSLLVESGSVRQNLARSLNTGRERVLSNPREERMAWKLHCCCSCRKFTLKPETNLALVLCLVFYLYICLGGALFLLLEGQEDAVPPRVQIDNTTRALVCIISVCAPIVLSRELFVFIGRDL